MELSRQCGVLLAGIVAAVWWFLFGGIVPAVLCVLLDEIVPAVW